MNEKERRNWILNKVESSEKGILVADLANELNVSLVTIRNDLSVLENSGYLTRFHGGALKKELSLENISNYSNKNKEIIARRALDHVQDQTTIVIGSGTTTAVFAQLLAKSKKKDLTILTNNILAIPHLILNANFHIIIIGGKYQRDNHSTFSPSISESIKSMTIDQMFSGADGFNEKMITSKNEGVFFSSEMAKHANETIVLAESFKRGKSFFMPVVETKNVSKIITEE